MMTIKNRRTLFLLAFVFSVSFQGAIAQSEYVKGFEYGFKQACSWNYNCMVKTIPLAPIPNYDDSVDSYRDGYNQGVFLVDELYSSRKGERYKGSHKIVIKPYYTPNYPLFIKTSLKLTDKLKDIYYNYSKGNYHIAKREFESIKYTSTNNPEFYAFRGVYNYKDSEYLKAKNDLKKAIKMGASKKNTLKAYYKSANYLSKKQKVDKQKSLTKSKVVSPRRKRNNYRLNRRDGFSVGFKAGGKYDFNFENNNLVPYAGIFFEIGISKAFGIALDFNYFYYDEEVEKYSNDYWGDYYEVELEKQHFVQGNFLIVNRLVKRLDLFYGIGVTKHFDLISEPFTIYSGVAGLRFYATPKLFLEGQYNFHLDENHRNLYFYEISKHNMTLGVGLKF